MADFSPIWAQAKKVIVSQEENVRLCVACILAQGHILIEDRPGVGKTTLVKFLTKVFGLKQSRIQFTNDILPADIIGTQVFDRDTGRFSFHRGPVFSELVFADEINRSSPRTQSAFLQAMEERQISVDGQYYELPNMFTVIATQNPFDAQGTFPLPESQLDRFMVRLSLGFPDPEDEFSLLKSETGGDFLDSVESVFGSDELYQMHLEVKKIMTSDPLIQYVQGLLQTSRTRFGRSGLSTRAGISLVQCAKAWAYVHGLDYVGVDEIQAVFKSVVGHRLPDTNAVDEIMKSVPIEGF